MLLCPENSSVTAGPLYKIESIDFHEATFSDNAKVFAWGFAFVQKSTKKDLIGLYFYSVDRLGKIELCCDLFCGYVSERIKDMDVTFVRRIIVLRIETAPNINPQRSNKDTKTRCNYFFTMFWLK